MRVLNINTEQFVSFALRNVIQKHYKHAEVISCCDYEEVLRLTTANNFDVIFLDMSIKTMISQAMMTSFAKTQQNAKVLMFYDEDTDYDLLKYMSLGVAGFLSKSFSEKDLLQAVNLVKAGQFLSVQGQA